MGNQHGSATLLGLIMMMLLGAMGATLLLLSKTDVQIATNHRDGMAAQYLAEAGIQEAVVKLKTDHDFVTQTETGKGLSTSQSLGTLPTAGSYTVHTGPDPQFASTQKRLITATGVVNQAKRVVFVQITLPSLQSGGLNPFVINWNY